MAAAHVNPPLHYEAYGWKEGHNPSTSFSTGKYLAANADVKAADVDPLLRYVAYGQAEGRSPLGQACGREFGLSSKFLEMLRFTVPIRSGEVKLPIRREQVCIAFQRTKNGSICNAERHIFWLLHGERRGNVSLAVQFDNFCKKFHVIFSPFSF